MTCETQKQISDQKEADAAAAFAAEDSARTEFDQAKRDLEAAIAAVPLAEAALATANQLVIDTTADADSASTAAQEAYAAWLTCVRG